jgi:hypothetical protein
MIQEIYLITGGLIGVTAFAIRTQTNSNNTAKNLSEFKTEMSEFKKEIINKLGGLKAESDRKTEAIKVELDTKVDKLERCVLEKIESLEVQSNKTQLEIVEIKGDTKHIRDSLHQIINLFNQHVLSKDV